MIALVVAGAAGVAALIGWTWWRGDGRMTRGSGERLLPHEAALPDDAFGRVATLLLLGSQQDDRTAQVRERLGALAEAHDGVAIAEVDLTTRGDLAGRWAVTRTPSVFVLDGGGRLRARVKGAGDADTLRAALDTVLRPGS